MTDPINQITDDLHKIIESFEWKLKLTTEHPQVEVGRVTEAGDGIVWIRGERPDVNVGYMEMLAFDIGMDPMPKGIVFNVGKFETFTPTPKEQEGGHGSEIEFETKKEVILVGASVIMGEYDKIKEGTRVYVTGEYASLSIGSNLIGRVINAECEPIDGKGPIAREENRPFEKLALGVVERKDVDTPVQTGIKAIDAMIPIGRGQRELIIGDRQTGKTALAIDTIINQKGKNLICIYVAIGQKKSAIARLAALLDRYGAMEHTIIVTASADDSVARQYIAPYVGCAIGEYFMERGQDALVVYDDLSKHAWTYRQMSLLLRRPPGREAYPGDIFYLHSRLLERAARRADEYAILPAGFSNEQVDPGDEKMLAKPLGGPRALEDAKTALAAMPSSQDYKVVKVKGSGGSLTALPIIETLLGDVSAYIPTNVISITDGQIYLENNLFNAGIRPAINVGISVSRVGGDAQTKAMKQVAGKLRLDMAAYRELAAFALMSSDLDKATQAQLTRGQRMQEILKQAQYEPMPLENQVMVIFAGTNGFADSVPVESMKKWELDLLRYLSTSHPDLGKDIATNKRITEENEKKLRDALAIFQSTWN